MKNKSLWLGMGTLLAAVAGGCAGVGSTVVAVRPISDGRPVNLTSYDLQVDGQPGGRILLADGQAIREADGRRLVRVGMRIENQSGDQVYRVPTGEIYLSRLAAPPIALTAIDRDQMPGTVEVAPGEARSVELVFALPARVRIDDVHAFKVHWALLIDGALQPIVRDTPFAASELDRSSQSAAPATGELPTMSDLKRAGGFPQQRAMRSGGRATAQPPM